VSGHGYVYGQVSVHDDGGGVPFSIKIGKRTNSNSKGEKSLVSQMASRGNMDDGQ
jgi:hypothetical protein